MSDVKSPYNFVPAPIEEQVFKPKWSSLVSHDIPFEDGESGEIEIEITAETPIFIRDGRTKLSQSGTKEEPAEFSHFEVNGKKQYFIPATSLKGMVRNVLEIMSFSRLNKDLVQNNRFSQRDISTSETNYQKKYDKESLCAGWLKEDKNGNWCIEKCEYFAFIDHKELKENFKLPFRDLFLVTVDRGKPKKLLKNAKEKYQYTNSLKFNFKTRVEDVKDKNDNVIGQRKVAIKDDRGEKGTLVFTGQPTPRQEISGKIPKGKIREFVFFDAEEPEEFKISETVQKDFRFIYNDHDHINISKDWKYFRDNFLEKNKKVPVFFLPGSNQLVKHLGLAYMYKLPYDQSVHCLNPIKKYENAPDLAHTIFGFTFKKNSLKGRVFFGHAFADFDTVKINDKPEEEILSSPKASYFPFYLEQFKKEGKDYYSYDDVSAILKGFKRYPVREKAVTGNYDAKQIQNKNTWSYFKPIQAEAKFHGKIRFHNLMKVEIGALLSALSFHDNADICFHSLGSAKPYGYGRVSVRAKLRTKEKNWSIEECLQEFEGLMDSEISDWINSDQITELFAMSILSTDDHNLQYPSISDYQDYKKREIKKVFKPIQKLDYFSIGQDQKPKIKRLVALKPTFRILENYPKGGGKVDAKVVGQEGLQMKVEVFLEGFEGKIQSVRYNDGLNYFGKDAIVELDLTFPNPKNKNQFNLNNPLKK